MTKITARYDENARTVCDWVHDSWIADTFSLRSEYVDIFRADLRQSSAQTRYRAGRRLLRYTTFPHSELGKDGRVGLVELHLLEIKDARRAAVLAGALGSVASLKRLISAADRGKFERVTGIAIDTFLRLADNEDHNASRILDLRSDVSASVGVISRPVFDADTLAIEGLYVLGAMDHRTVRFRAPVSCALPMETCEAFQSFVPKLRNDDDASRVAWTVVRRCMPEVTCLFG